MKFLKTLPAIIFLTGCSITDVKQFSENVRASNYQSDKLTIDKSTAVKIVIEGGTMRFGSLDTPYVPTHMTLYSGQSKIVKFKNADGWVVNESQSVRIVYTNGELIFDAHHHNWQVSNHGKRLRVPLSRPSSYFIPELINFSKSEAKNIKIKVFPILGL